MDNIFIGLVKDKHSRKVLSCKYIMSKIFKSESSYYFMIETQSALNEIENC